MSAAQDVQRARTKLSRAEDDVRGCARKLAGLDPVHQGRAYKAAQTALTKAQAMLAETHRLLGEVTS